MLKYIAIFLVAAELALIAYNLIGSGPAPIPGQESVSQPHVAASRPSPADAPRVMDAPTAREEVPRAVTPASSAPPKRSSVAADTAMAREEPSWEAEADSEEQREEAEAYGEEPDAPPVPRAKLIGGADVEWIPPKPKKPGEKFGEPPL